MLFKCMRRSARHYIRLGAASLALLPMVTACGETAERPQVAAASEGENLTVTVVERSPLETYFGTEIGAEDLLEDINQVLRVRADAITACMASEGFAFYVEPAEVRTADIAQSGRWSDHIRASGYGAAEGLRGIVARQEGGAVVAEQHRRNAAAFAELSGETQQAFSDAYRPCRTQAESDNPEPGGPSSISAEVQTELLVVQQQISTDSGFNTIWAEWADCMRSSGYNFRTRFEAVNSLGATVSGIQQELISTIDHGLSENLAERIDSLAAEEEELVAADLGCADSLAIDDRLWELQVQLEEEAITLNGDRWTLMLGSESGS